jgi:homoserine dehydrogenase
MTVKDRPGVLASVATEFGKREVSIAEVRQEGILDADGQAAGARIVVVTHRATDAALSDTVTALAGLEAVQEVNSVLRLEGTSE